ncbi:MAG: tRNA (N(6)-L-threonylcarbamoyladenosine(37)-C(2))-methylthiotransferase [Thermoplasmata archaeon]|nr:tRNA (N(6)-L-threonylcarbamoyladenosine(37)-C(2))-methylthiotransferase [Thermoplasmata archaeon]
MNIYVETYGCTANKSDERLLMGLLKHNHHEIVDNIKDADVLVLLTCTVIGTTEQRMLSRLKVFQKTHKKIVVTGCMPSVQPELITSIVPNAFLIPPQYIQYINDIMDGNKPSFTETKKTMLPKYFDTVIAPIAIAEGCLLSCSYCITHFARGKLRSFPIQEIAADVCSAIKQGCKEIQLTAQDTASYGLDTRTNLGMLLTQVCTLDGAFRVRVGMMNPTTVQKNLDSILTAYKHHKIYKFLHLPVQSGDDEILEKMNRGYTVKDFTRLVERFRKTIPTLTLSTDVIIGFPTETEEQFNRTIELLKQIKPDIINITRFSARPLTTAKTMKGRVPTHVVKERSKRTTEICSKISREKNQEHLKKTYMVLVTEKGKQKTFTGRAENYKQVVLTEPVAIGDFVHVEIIDAAPTYLVGKLI